MQGQNDSISPNQIKLSVEQIVNPINWGVKLSYEKIYASNKLSTEIGGTLLIPTPDKFKQNGFRIHVSERFFYKRKRIHQYIGLGYEYQNSTFRDVSYFEPADSVVPGWPNYSDQYQDNYTGHKELHCINVLWGFQLIKGHFVFDLGLGLGLKYRMVQHFDRENPDFVMSQPRHPSTNYYSTVESKRFHFNFPLTIKIGYTF